MLKFLVSQPGGLVYACSESLSIRSYYMLSDTIYVGVFKTEFMPVDLGDDNGR
jgi:hypothetical protein